MHTVRILLAVAIALGAGCAFDETGLPPRPEPEPPSSDPAGEPTPGLDEPVPEAPPVAYRVTELVLREPHVFANGGFGCTDVTDSGEGSVNDRIADDLTSDRDGDGFFDASVMVLVSESGRIELAHADCTAGPGQTSCALREPMGQTSVAAHVEQGVCDAPDPSWLSGYEPAIDLAAGPCFESAPTTFVLELDDPIPYSAVVVAAETAPDGTALTGTFRGFLSEADADALELGDGRRSTVMSRLLPGGDGSCAQHDDRDTGPEGAPGWYSYYEIAGEEVILVE